MPRAFHCVFLFEAVDFRLQGVFTKKEDALALAKEINANYEQNSDGTLVYVVDEFSLNDIINVVLQERLGILYEPLKRLAGIPDHEPAASHETEHA